MTTPIVAVTIVSDAFTGSPVANGSVTLQLTAMDVVAGTNGATVSTAPQTFALDATGQATVQIFPNAVQTGLGTRGTSYKVTILDSTGAQVGSGFAQIPNSACNLHDNLVNIANPTGLTDGVVAVQLARSYRDQAAASQSAVAYIYPSTYNIASLPTTRPNSGGPSQAGDTLKGSDGYEYHYTGSAWVSDAKNAAGSASSSAHIYPTVYSTPPTTRPDGSAIQAGDLYVGSDTYTYRYVGGGWVNQTAAAAASAANAQGSANSAAGSLTQVQSYAAAAASGAKFYDTIALGVNTGSGGVAVGSPFGVRAGQADGLTRPAIYKNVDGTAANALKLYDVLPATEYDSFKASLASVTQQIGAPAPITGSPVSTQVVVWNDVVTKDGFLDSVTLFVLATGTLKIARFTVSGSTATRVAEAAVTLASTGLVTLTASDFGLFPVKAGENLALYAFPSQIGYTGATADGSGWRGGTYGATVSLGATQTTFRIQANFNVSTQTVTASALTPVNGGGSLSLSNVDKICLLSNSYGAAAASLVGKSPVAIASALSEYNWANFSQGGASIITLLGRSTDGTVIWGATFPQHKPTHVIISENQNSKNTLSDSDYYAYYQKMIDTVRGMGAIPIIMTEWGIGTGNAYGSVQTFDGEQRNVKGLRALAEANRCPFIDGTSKSRTMNSQAYVDFWKSAHPGVRAMYIITDALRKTSAILPRPLRSMKIFRVRGTVTVTGVNDLLFRTLAERHHLFREIYIGQSALADTQKQYYDTASSITVGANIQDINDEYYALKSGTSTSLGTYCLVECVLPSSGATGIKLQISDTSCTVYARKMYTGGPSWVQLSLGGGQFVVPDGQGLADNDSVAFLIYKSTGVSLNASPVVSWTAGTPRLPAQPEKLYPPRGSEMLAQPLTVVSGAVPAQWTNSGSLPAVTPFDAITPTGTTGCVEVTTSAGLSQPVTYASSDDPTEIVVRVWARRWVAKFDSAGDFSTAPVTYETCDTATLQVTLCGASGLTSASAVLVDQVGLHWREVEFRETLPALTTATTIDVRSADSAIQIAKVSVRPA